MTKNYFNSKKQTAAKTELFSFGKIKNIITKNLAGIFILLFGLFGTIDIFAQRNDCDDNAGGELTVNSSCTFTAWNSNNNSDYWNSATGCNATDQDDAWGWFDAIANSTTITYSPDTRNAVLTLFEGACATTMTAVACADALGNGGDETITYATTPGLRYRVRIQRVGSNLNMTGDICVYSVLPPTITSLSNTSGCVGSSLVINGTNLTGATAVTIGGTAATITGNTATTVTVTVGTGTTGTVQVTTPNGTATSAATFTVNPLPAAIGGGAATVCVGGTTPAFTNATGGGTWSITNGTGSATISAGGVVTGVSIGTATVVYTLPTSCSISTPITIVTTPNITTNPANFTTSVGGAANFSVTANNSPSSYTWEVSTNGGGTWTTVTNGGVYSNATTATLNITGATSGMDGYLYRASASNACGSSGFSTAASLTVSNIILVTGAGTNSVTCGNNAILKDHAGDADYASGRNDWTVIDAGLGSTITLSGNYSVENSFDFINIYDGSGIGGTLLFTYTGTGTINFIGTPGQTITIQFTSDGSVVDTGFQLNVTYSGVCNPVCSTPTAQPTALVLTPGSTTVNGTFGASVPASDSYLVVMNTTGIAPSPVDGTTYTIGGTVGAGNTVIDIDGNTSFVASGLSPLTTYYFFVFSASSACTGGPLYLTTTPLTGSTTTILSYCAAGGSNPASSWISNVNLSAINTNTAAWAGYTDYYPTTNTDLTRTISYTISVTIFNATTSQKNISAWIDWNKNGVFDVGTETILSTTSTVATGQFVTLTNTFTVPVGAVVDETRMRVELAFDSQGAATPCNTNTLTDVQDYRVNVLDIFPCVTPTSQPTALMLTPSGNTISGSFAPAVPSSDSYLVVINTTGIAPPNPTDGTSYTIGGTLGAGNIIVDNDNNTSFVATGLTTTTTYYFFIYSFNAICTGGPLYNSTSPLTGNGTTTTADPVYCTPSVGATYESLTYFSNISFVGTLNDISNSSSYSSAPRGYQDFSAIPDRSRQAQGEGINISTQTTNRGYLKAWVDWNRDGDFQDAGETVYDVGGIASYSTTFGFIIPPAQPIGNYRVRIRINKDDNVAPIDPNAISTFDECQNIDYYGETEDYTFTVVASCSAIITSVTDGTTCGTGTVDLNATSAGSPTEYRWYTTEFGGTPLGTTATGSWTTPSISSTTTYWVTGFNGCESLVRTKVTAHVSPLATISFTPSVPEVCGENNVLSLTATGDVQQTYLVDEKFESGLGVMTNQTIISNGGTVDAISDWQTQSSTFVPSEQVWFPAIGSGLSGNGFAMATSDTGQDPVSPFPTYITHNAILTPTVSTNTYLNLTLSFDIFYSRYYIDTENPTLDYVTVDVSTNGGAAWIEIDRYLADIGYGTRFENKTYDLSAYINQPNFRVRIRYYGEWADGLAIDNFQLYGDVPLNTAFDWSAASPVDAYQDAACTIPYISGTPIVTVYVRPSLAQLEETTYNFTATATLSNGCSVSQAVSIDNNSSVWKGTTSDDWNDPNNWLPVGVPSINTCVIIPDVTSTNPSNITGAGYDAFGRTLQVLDDGILNLVSSNNTLTIQNYVEVEPNGTFNIGNTSSLIQIDNVANTGNINMDRFAFTNNTLDYVYWSTPVGGFDVNNITPLSTRVYSWSPTTASGYTSDFGNWAVAAGGMTNGLGYIVGGSFGMTTFTGVPNNGDITTPISRSTYTGAAYAGPTTTLVTADDDNWNLLGNPYPSAISADDFLAANSANLNQWVKIWTHGIDPAAIADPFYQDFLLNYSTADYITYNALGGTQFGFDGYIGAAQGFFVLMNDANSTSENAVFNNTMRSNTYRNDQFFRQGIEKHRIWLDIVSPSNESITTLVGYTTDASNDLDNKYDAIAQGVKTNFEIYSIAESKELIIQGRSLPFNQNDEVTLGVAIPENGIYTIAITNVDGLFLEENQKIYLEDKQLGIFHDLRTAPYTFTGVTGRNENRFVILYNSSRLSQDDNGLSNNIMIVSNENVTIHSSLENITSIEVHDMLGRNIKTYNNIENKEFMLSNLQKNNTTLLLRIKLTNGEIVDKKIIY